MENLGALAILLAFCFAIYALIGSIVGRLARRPFLIQSGQRAVYTVWLLVTIAAGSLIYSIIAGDYRLAYVWETSNKTMPIQYKFAAWWGGQAGSLLFWSWLLSTYSAVVVFQNRKKFREMMPWVIVVLMSTQTFFLILNAFVVSPFKLLMAGKCVIDLGDGQGLNPLLQYWTMVIHPPMLYLGYVGFAVPFAFAMGSLITKQPGDACTCAPRPNVPPERSTASAPSTVSPRMFVLSPRVGKHPSAPKLFECPPPQTRPDSP